MIAMRVALDAVEAFAGGIRRVNMDDNIGQVRKMMHDFMPGHLRQLMCFTDQ